MRRLENRVCLITGGAGSIGMAVARRFSAEGARLMLADRDADKLAARAASEEAADWATFVADVGQEEDVQRLIQATVERFGRLDVLVNNAAGWQNDGPVTEIAAADWDAIQAATLRSVFLCSKHAIPVMQGQSQGAIINIASVNAIFGLALAAYSAAKGGVLALTQVMAAMHGAQGIRVNAISPGTIHTEAWTPVLAQNPAALEEWAARYLLHRVGMPEEVAALAAHLASDEAANTTGANFVMDGGLSAGREIGTYVTPKERG